MTSSTKNSLKPPKIKFQIRLKRKTSIDFNWTIFHSKRILHNSWTFSHDDYFFNCFVLWLNLELIREKRWSFFVSIFDWDMLNDFIILKNRRRKMITSNNKQQKFHKDSNLSLLKINYCAFTRNSSGNYCAKIITTAFWLVENRFSRFWLVPW